MIRIFVSTEENDIVSALIRRLTMCSWSHTGFLREDGFTFSAMHDGLGVNWRPPNPKAKVLALTVPRAEEALDKALSRIGEAYDVRDIMGFFVNRNWETPHRAICDVLLFWAFAQIGQPLLNHTFVPMGHLTPRDVLLSPLISEMKEVTFA